MILKNELKKLLTEPLPGYAAQKKMAPNGRAILPTNISVKKAAVVLLIYPGENSHKEIVFIRRPDYDGPHGGQVSFPGGKMDREDKDLVNTAIRECYEEIGVKIDAPDYVGSLSPLQISISKFLVHPFVFILDKTPEFFPNNQEVLYLIKFRLTDLFDTDLIKKTRLIVRNEETEVPYYAIQNEIVWGATAIILAEFIDILKRLKSKNPGLL